MPSFRSLARGVISALLAALSLAVILQPTLAFSADEAPTAFGKPDILEVLEIRGEIDRNTAAVMKAQVEKVNENPKVKAVLLIVDTPGGGATASAMLYAEIAKIKVPVVGYCEYVCASGGIYALMAPSIKFIAVGDETISGSVGVVMHLTRFNRLLDWAKIDNETYKSGVLKDAGNPTRAGTDAERAYLQGIIDDLAMKFYGVVAKSRPKADIKDLALAKIYIGAQAVKVGLADAVMSRDEAVAKAKQLSKAKLVFTREELGRMSKAAQGESSTYRAPLLKPDEIMAGDLHYLVDVMKEIRSGESIRFEYRAPYQF